MTNPALLDRVSDVIGWGLIHFLWQGTVLAVLLGMGRANAFKVDVQPHPERR